MCGRPETMLLKKVKLQISSYHSDVDNPLYEIDGAFPSENICSPEYTYDIDVIQQRYSHLEGIPLRFIDHASPVILIGSDYANLIVPTSPVQFWPE